MHYDSAQLPKVLGQSAQVRELSRHEVRRSGLVIARRAEGQLGPCKAVPVQAVCILMLMPDEDEMRQFVVFVILSSPLLLPASTSSTAISTVFLHINCALSV